MPTDTTCLLQQKTWNRPYLVLQTVNCINEISNLHYKMAVSTAICMTVIKTATQLSCNTNE